MPSDPPLSDDEICRKFQIERANKHFDAARRISQSRPDRIYADLPMVTCPHCGQEFQKEDYYEVEDGDEWECPLCERTIYVESVDTKISVVLVTDPPAE